MDKITDLLHELHDLFPTKFAQMKGIWGDLGEMKIPLNTDAKPQNKFPYRLNPWYNDCVKAKLDRMLDDGIMKPVEELEWMSLMVVQENNKGEIWIFIGLRKLNDTSIHDLFPMPFIDEVLEAVKGQ